MEKITTVGLDLAKSVFSLHGVDAGGRTVLRKTVRRDKLMELIASLPPCLIGMEACGGAHEWARQFQRHGHRVGIMMARFVAPYRKSSKNDGNDAEAICEAVARPNMRFVPVKKLSAQMTSWPSRIRRSQRWEPRNPAPPVTNTRFLRSYDRAIGTVAPLARRGKQAVLTSSQRHCEWLGRLSRLRRNHDVH